MTGAVLLIQPRNGSLRLSWTSGVSLSSFWIQLYYGPFHGSVV